MRKNIIRWYSTIRIKVISVVVISCTLVVGSLSAYNIVNEQKQLTSSLQKLASVTSQRLSKHLIGPMWDLDKDMVDATLQAEMLEDNIQAVVVWDEGAKSIFAARERDPNGELIESNGAIAGDFVKAVSEVNNGTRSIGEVAVFVSRKPLNQHLTAATITNVITLLALVTVISVVLIIVMNQIIIEPITRLAKHAEDISHGNLKQKILPQSRDEIGQLAETFHRMQASLRIAFKRIYAKAKST